MSLLHFFLLSLGIVHVKLWQFSQDSVKFFVQSNNLCSSVLMVSSADLNPLPPVFLCMYSLASLALRCSALLMVTILHVFLPMFSNSSFVRSRFFPEYLRTATAHTFTALMILPPSSFDSYSLFLLMYSFFILFASNTLRYL